MIFFLLFTNHDVINEKNYKLGSLLPLPCNKSTTYTIIKLIAITLKLLTLIWT